ncbi:hypothetical protein N9937_02035 [bacterium]|nr:hypothetical protein [bacterium]
MKTSQLKLIYVDGPFAYFTDEFDKAWGDDWDDVPYEHNAGHPYGRYFVIMYDNRENGYGIPRSPNHGHLNSPYSVDDINNMHVPWIIVEAGPIFGGHNVATFEYAMQESGRQTVRLGWEGSDDT